MKHSLILFIIAMLFACSTDTSGISASPVREGKQWLVVDNITLGRKLTVVDARSVEQADRLRALATLQSLFKEDLHLQYRFYWYDQDGVQLKADTTAWRPITLHGQQQTQVQSLAVSASATDFKIYVREVHSE